ncbi:MAG: hypothetical protein ACFWT2_15705 [Thermoanaerobacterium thermosaccharolyticum]|jgi:hypothetical protein
MIVSMLHAIGIPYNSFKEKIKITKKYSCCDYRLTDLSTGDRQGVIYIEKYFYKEEL